MHTDEAANGVRLGRILEGERFVFDPAHYHGPTLPAVAAGVARLAGRGRSAELSEGLLRGVTAACGVVLLALLAGWRKDLGAGATLAAVALAAVSPGLVYYNRDFIHESLLTAGGYAMALAMWRRLQGGAWGWALAAGGAAGWMHATKLTSTLYWVALAAALAVWLGRRRGRGAAWPEGRWWGLTLGAGAAGFAAVALPLSSWFGTDWGALLDSFRSWWSYQPGEGHEKPWWYYGALLAGNEPVFWLAAAILGGGAVGRLRAGRGGRRATPGGFAGKEAPGEAAAEAGWWVGTFTATLLALYSIIGYKTPWLVTGALPGLALLAGIGVVRGAGRWAEGKPRGEAVLAGAALTAALWFSLGLCVDRCFRRAADPANLYAYVQTSPELVKLARTLEPLRERAEGREAGPSVQVVGEEYFPLPWYLRSWEKAGYWTNVPAEVSAPVVVLGPPWNTRPQEAVAGGYVLFESRLRPGVPLAVLVRMDYLGDFLQALEAAEKDSP